LGVSAIMGVYNLFQISQLGTSARIDGTFGSPTFLSVFMLVLFFVNLFLFVQKKIPLYAFIILAALQCIAIYFSGTRGAIIGLVGGLLLTAMLIAIGEKQNKTLRLLALGLIVTLTMLIIGLFSAKNTTFVQESPVLSRFDNISLNESTIKESRLYVWPMAIEGFKEKPLLGWGQEGFRYVFDKNYNPEMYDREAWFDRVHSAPLEWLVAGGLFGFLTYCGLFLVALYMLWRRTDLTYIAKSVFTGMFAAYTLQNLFVFDSLFSYILFFSLLAYLHFASTPKISKQSNDGLTANLASPSFILKLIPIMALAVFAMAMYNFNYKPILASQAHIQALAKLETSDGRGEFMRLVEKAISFNTFGNTVFREQLIKVAPLFLQPGTPSSLTKSYFNLVDREYQKQIIEFPNDTISRLDYGLFLSRFGQFENSLAQYRKALELSPNRQNTWSAVGAMYLDKKQYIDAVSYFQHAHELAPQFDVPRIWYAISLVYIDDIEKSNKLLAEVPVHKLIADDRLINAHIYMENHEQLVPLFSERVRLNPNDPKANVSLAVALLRSNDFTSSAQILESFIQRNPQFERDLRGYIKEIKAGRDPSS
jgi:tetratricopeptide (TPR) repeat protein